MSDDLELLLEHFRRQGKIKAWMPVVMAEIIGDKLKSETPSIPKPPEVPKIPVLEVPKTQSPPRPVTRTIDWKEKRVEFELSLFDVKVGGKLQELMLRGPSKNYSIVLVTDGILRLYKTFEEMEVVSAYLDTIDAFEENGVYLLHLKDYSWLESAYSVISVKETIVFDNVFLKWDELI